MNHITASQMTKWQTYPGGAPMRRATECCSMYSDISRRTSWFSLSNSCSAKALANSVLPTPVGPRKRNDPVGCCCRPKPALDLNTASATACTASFWPTTRWCNRSARPRSRAFSFWPSLVTGIPVQRLTTWQNRKSNYNRQCKDCRMNKKGLKNKRINRIIL